MPSSTRPTSMPARLLGRPISTVAEKLRAHSAGMMFCFAATIKPIFLHWVGTDRTPEIAPNRRNLLYDVDRTCSEPDDRIKHVLDTDPRPAGIPLPPSSHAKAVN